MMEELLILLRKSCEGDDAAWQQIIHYFSDNALDADTQRQVHLYLNQAVKRYTHALVLRAQLYDLGYGVKQDHTMGFLLMREAAVLGHGLAVYEIGRRFFDGVGVDQHYGSAMEWLEAAAASPYYRPEAMFYLGRLYEEGRGVPHDVTLAKQWYEKAAARNHEEAKKRLAMLS